MKILHVSDAHGHLPLLTNVPVGVDVIVWTGDNLPTFGRVNGRINRMAESLFQTKWLDENARTIAAAIGDIPLVSVRGNHDFTDWSFLGLYGVTLHQITAKTPACEVHGKCFAGFPETQWLDGEWSDEVWDLRPAIDRAFAHGNCDILVTHTPPGNILDYNIGSGFLQRRIQDCPSVKAHFFGHAHEQGGQAKTINGVLYANGALHSVVHEID